VCLALASSVFDKPVGPEMVAIGEVGLGGEVRRVSGMAKRLAEAGRLGFHRALVPASPKARPEQSQPRAAPRAMLRELPAATLGEALSLAFGAVGS
jgi:DNA repair protein RadA/Sms